MGFRFLEHTADMRAECRAPTFTGVLETAAQALYALTLRETRAGRDSTCTIAVKGSSREELLVRWLQELIFLLDVDRFVATEFTFSGDDPSGVTAEVRGYICLPDERAEEVKSATYHELEVRDTDEGCVAHVIFDL